MSQRNDGRWRMRTPEPPVPGDYRVNALADKSFKATDAPVLKYDPPHLITSPNVTYIPHFNPHPTALRPRLNGKFGADDYTEHPQPRDLAARERHECYLLWDGDWAHQWHAYGGVFNSQGVMVAQEWDKLASVVMRIKQKAEMLNGDPSLPAVYYTTLTALGSGLQRLRSYPMTLQDFVLQRAQVQRMALDMDAMISYQTVYAKRCRVSGTRFKADADCMGAFTNNPTVADMLKRSGLPVWLIRNDESVPPGSVYIAAITDQWERLVEVVEEDWFDMRSPAQFQQYVPYTSLGVVGHELERMSLSRTMGRLYNNLVPFALGTATKITEDQMRHPFPTLSPSSPTRSATSPYSRAASPVFNAIEDPVYLTQSDDGIVEPSFTSCSTPGVSRRARSRRFANNGRRSPNVTGGISKKHPNQGVRVRQSKEPAQFNRDKFAPCMSDVYPVQLEEWTSALQAVNRSCKSLRLLPRERSGYMFPDPAFIASQAPTRRLHDITLWLAFRPSQMGQLLLPIESHPPPLDSATWQQLFWLARAHAYNPARESRAPEHDSFRAVKVLDQMFGVNASQAVNLDVPDVRFYGRSFTVKGRIAEGINDDVLRSILWELCEVNYQYELCALDRAAAPHKWTGTSGPLRLRAVFRAIGPSAGLHGWITWNEAGTHMAGACHSRSLYRHCSMHNLRDLMLDWPDCPQSLQDNDMCFDDSDCWDGPKAYQALVDQKCLASNLLSLQQELLQRVLYLSEMSLRPKTFKARGTNSTRKIRGRHIIVSSYEAAPMDTSRAASAAMRQDAMPIAGPSGVRATFPASRVQVVSRPPTPPPPGTSLAHDGQFSVEDAEPDSTDQPPTHKRDAQWRKWNLVVFPRLIPLYLHLQRTSQGFTRLQEPEVVTCSCGGKDSKHIDVMCLHFGGAHSSFKQNQNLRLHGAALRRLELAVYSCDPAPVQLLRHGLFACAPTYPTLAVDVKLLDFARIQFVTMVPNVSGWCEAVELFLRSMSYKLTTKRFSNALRWYYALVDGAAAHMLGVIEGARATLEQFDLFPSSWPPVPLPPSSPPYNPSVDRFSSPDSSEHSSPTSGSSPNLPQSHADIPPSSNAPPSRSTSPSLSLHEASDPPEVVSASERPRPSAYLRRRCPLCFGGELIHDSNALADFIVSIDACFTQKRNKYGKYAGHRDGHRAHHDTCFLPEADVAVMEADVAAARSRRSRNPPPPPPDDQDNVEFGMGVPTSVLNDCNDSFIAADEKREKASTQHFADTGLMSLICRHDRLLFVVNMTHCGERQHYGLALIRALFSHIPQSMTVGILYDIGCQLKRSMLKFGYLADVYDRIIFGVSVFHAYGHQWACQLIYHPRKCSGFGLSDGEGCERLWSAIRKLIPTLRVSGIQHLTDKSTENLGAWLSRRYESCLAFKQEASAELLRSKKDKTFLCSQWQAQVRAQTAPAPRQSKNKGKQAVEAILVLDSSIQEEAKLVNQLHNDYVAGRGDAYDVAELLKDAESRLSRMQQLRNQKFKALGIPEANALSRLKNNNFLKTRMNALAVKQRLRDRLRQRKFELERLERSYRHTINDSKADSQVQDALKRRAPAIQRLAKTYNSLCDSLSGMLRQRNRGQVPPGAVAPEKSPEGGLWALDVDDSIWQDVGLDELSEGAPPPWLSDEDTRAGIRAMLNYDRACEEEARVFRERVALQDWLIEVWAVVQKAKQQNQGMYICSYVFLFIKPVEIDDIDMLYHLESRSRELCRLCFLWREPARIIPVGNEMWGPPEELIRKAGMVENTAYVKQNSPSDSEVGSVFNDTDMPFDDDELQEQIDCVALHDEYIPSEDGPDHSFFMSYNDNQSHKRRRVDYSSESD
ncbi:hypothetical protein HWV62_25014 [Athelia sp. TMB]|nr:hypothetical protein HWV62_25014 [Athelia sp. TMB]